MQNSIIKKVFTLFCFFLVLGFYGSFSQNSENLRSEKAIAIKPLMGSLSILDDGNAEHAQACINKQQIGMVPFVKKSLNAGEYAITIKKDGYISLKNEYIVTIRPGEDIQLRVSMELFKDFFFKSDPPNAEIWLDGQLIGLSDNTFPIPILYHNIMIIKSGYATEKFNIFVDQKTPDKEEIFRKLKINYPLTVLNEGKINYHLIVKGIDSLSNIFIDNGNRVTGQEIMLPYGKYQLTITDGKKTLYRGRHTHSSDYKPIIKLPLYSRTSFKTLTLDYVNLNNFEASIGESQIFGGSGLSTSLLNVQYLTTEVKRSWAGNPEYIDTMAIVIPSLFFLNWDFRIGGSITRTLDICALGRIKYSPGLKFLGVHIEGCNDVMAMTYFYGMELSTRFPFFNLNLKVGNQIVKGTSFVFDNNTGDFSKEKIPIDVNGPVVSFGVVINGPIDKTNNMLRLWKRPLLGEYLRKVFN